MINHIIGKVVKNDGTSVVIECGGIGYSVLVSLATSDKLEIGTNTTLLTLLILREDSVTLYGFANETERQLFLLLTSVQGIGPKNAIVILSALEISEFINAILNKDAKLLQKLPNVGKKTAERLIIELQDKIGKLDVTIEKKSSNSAILEEAVEALIVLGWNRATAERVVKNTLGTINTAKGEVKLEDLIRMSLRDAVR